MNTSITRFLALLLSISLLLGMAACASADAGEQTQQETPTIRIPEPENYTQCTELGTPLADQRVRQALICAIDLDTVIQALYDRQAERSEGLLASLEAQAWDYGYDPDKAKELLAQAGWPSDYVLDVVYVEDDRQSLDLLQVIGSYWEAVGVKARFRKLEGDIAQQLWTAPDDPQGDSEVQWDLALVTLMPMTQSQYYSGFASDAENNSHTPQIEGLDESIEAGDYEQAERILAEQAAYIPLLHHNGYIYISDHIDTGSTEFGNDLFAWNKNIQDWTTDREDETLYSAGGPEEYLVCPAAEPGAYLYQELIFECLIGADELLEPAQGKIARSYTLSEDGKTLEFVIGEELYWHDGEPLTAEDVKFTFELYMQCPDTGAALQEVLEMLEGAEEFLNGDSEECSGIRLEEDKVIFTFEEAPENALQVFSQWPVLPKHKLKNVKPAKLAQNKFWKSPIGSGPYKVAKVIPGESVTLERWEDYRETGEGNIRYIVLRSTGDTNGELAVLAARDLLDYGWGRFTEDASCIESLEGMDVQEIPILCTQCFLINQYPHPSRFAAEASE